MTYEVARIALSILNVWMLIGVGVMIAWMGRSPDDRWTWQDAFRVIVFWPIALFCLIIVFAIDWFRLRGGRW